MSLFDVIKYPISDKLTADELRAVPVAIIRKWHRDPIVYQNNVLNSAKLLRKLILEYNK